MDGELTPAQKFLLKECNKASQKRQQWLKGKSGLTCGVVVIIGTFVPLVSCFGYYDSLVSRLMVLSLYSLVLVGIIWGITRFFNSELIHKRRVSEQYDQHIRHVLLDQGLLAILLADPGKELPRSQEPSVIPLKLHANFPMSPFSITQRLDYLMNCFEEVCWHYRLEPYPTWKSGEKVPLNSPSPAILAKISIAKVLFEELGSDTQYAELTKNITTMEAPKQ